MVYREKWRKYHSNFTPKLPWYWIKGITNHFTTPTADWSSGSLPCQPERGCVWWVWLHVSTIMGGGVTIGTRRTRNAAFAITVGAIPAGEQRGKTKFSQNGVKTFREENVKRQSLQQNGVKYYEKEDKEKALQQNGVKDFRKKGLNQEQAVLSSRMGLKTEGINFF